MKNISIKVSVIFLVFALMIISCKNDDNDNGNGDGTPLIFSELKAESDTIYAGASTTITATATGYKLTYYWSATAGDIFVLGAGKIEYGTPPCILGVNTVTCTVKDGNNNSETKSIDIVVL